MTARLLSGLGTKERSYPLPDGPEPDRWAFRIFSAMLALGIVAFLAGVLGG